MATAGAAAAEERGSAGAAGMGSAAARATAAVATVWLREVYKGQREAGREQGLIRHCCVCDIRLRASAGLKCVARHWLHRANTQRACDGDCSSMMDAIAL